ncbi:MAG: undecaprenyl-diphosphate phosphatase [Oscillospiraceae bacterium]|nr:undecaprenyl-diphosphate phosphatase [Oscillospiraceae bacterium]
MDLNFFQSLLYGLIAGLSDILPVSAQAHKLILLKVFGTDSEPPVLRLLIHMAILGALYYCCQAQIKRLIRQQKLARIPKKRRKRPVDMRSILDVRLLQTMLIPVILGFGLYFKTVSIGNSLMWLAVFLFINGIVLFLPRILPSGNKDSRSMSRVDGLMMGLGATAAALPGISSIGAATSVATIRGTERSYALNMALRMHMAVTAGMIIYDLYALVAYEAGTLTFGILMGYLFAAICAFVGTFLGVRVMRALAVHTGFDVFSYYCWGLALFAFILYLSV